MSYYFCTINVYSVFILIILAEMSTKYKVHEGFHLKDVAFEEEYCHCIPANESMYIVYCYF